MIWQAPISRVAERLGLSDCGLAKACARYNIPVPFRGYWAKKAAGQSVAVLPLPPGPPTPIVLRRRGNAVERDARPLTVRGT